MAETSRQGRISEHQEQTVFLRQCLLYAGTAASRQLAEQLLQLQREERSVRRAAWLAALLAALGVTGLGYTVLLTELLHAWDSEFLSKFFVKGCLGLGLASLICLVSFLCLWAAYRKDLNQRRGECRRLVTGLLEAHLGPPADLPSRHSPGGTVPIAAGVEGGPHKSAFTASS